MDTEHVYSIAKILLKSEPGQSLEVERILGGKNNQAYRVDAAKESYFMKVYHQDPADTRRRGNTEYRWIATLWNCGIRSIPKPFSFHESQNQCAGLYEFVSGSSVQLQNLNDEYVRQALDFLIEINSIRTNSSTQLLPLASEACFSIREHLTVIQTRVERLSQIPVSSALVYERARKFVTQELQPTWKRLVSRFGGEINSLAPISDRILSPSDFGFHNALVTEKGKIHFIDFEYAGWDDPAKLICDFFNQVAIPVPKSYFPVFLNGFSKIVPDLESLSERIACLYPFYRIKWICILLNYFLPSDGRRKKFALQTSGNWESLLCEQLQSATHLLETLELDASKFIG